MRVHISTHTDLTHIHVVEGALIFYSFYTQGEDLTKVTLCHILFHENGTCHFVAASHLIVFITRHSLFIILFITRHIRGTHFQSYIVLFIFNACRTLVRDVFAFNASVFKLLFLWQLQ